MRASPAHHPMTGRSAHSELQNPFWDNNPFLLFVTLRRLRAGQARLLEAGKVSEEHVKDTVVVFNRDGSLALASHKHPMTPRAKVR